MKNSQSQYMNTGFFVVVVVVVVVVVLFCFVICLYICWFFTFVAIKKSAK